MTIVGDDRSITSVSTLMTGQMELATGDTGKRQLPVLIEEGHEVVCCVRDENRFLSDGIHKHSRVSKFGVDFPSDISLHTGSSFK